MPAAYLIPDSGPFIYFDITVSELHQGTANVTEKPVERGANVADHARLELDRVTLVCFVTSSGTDLPDGSRGGKKTTEQLDVPKYDPPFTPTPGAIFGALGDAIRNAFADPAPGTNTVLTFAKEFDAREDVEKALRRLQEKAILTEIVTSFRSYKDMFLESFEMPIDEDSCDGAQLTLNFMRLRIVETKIVNAPRPTEPRGQKAKSKGHKDPIPPDVAKRQSILFGMNQAAKASGLPGF